MLARVAMPAVRQKRSKLAPTSCQASSMVATGTTAADVVGSFMALLSFVDSAPRAYRLKVGNACPPISTSNGTSPSPSMGEGWEGVMFPAAQVEKNEVRTNLDGVNQTIADELGRITPTRTLPHHGGGLYQG